RLAHAHLGWSREPQILPRAEHPVKRACGAERGSRPEKCACEGRFSGGYGMPRSLVGSRAPPRPGARPGVPPVSDMTSDSPRDTPCILVVDDEPSENQFLSATVRGLGHATHACYDGQAA